MTNYLLMAVIILLGVRIYQAHSQHRNLIIWLDALGEMVGDMLRQIIDKGDNHDGN